MAAIYVSLALHLCEEALHSGEGFLHSLQRFWGLKGLFWGRDVINASFTEVEMEESFWREGKNLVFSQNTSENRVHCLMLRTLYIFLSVKHYMNGF